MLVGALLLAGGSVSVHAQAIWPKFRFDLQNTGRSPELGPANPGIAWSVPTGGPVSSSAAIGADGTTYVGSEGGLLYALTPEGFVGWTFDAGSPIGSSPAIDDEAGLIYFGTDAGDLIALSFNGLEQWRFEADGPIVSSPSPTPFGIVVFGTLNGTIYGVEDNVSAGGQGKKLIPEALWAVSTGGPVAASPAYYENSNLELTNAYVGSEDGIFYAIDVFSGQIQWTMNAGAPIVSSAAVDGQGTAYFGNLAGRLFAVPDGGVPRWAVLLGGAIESSPALSGTRVYVGADDNNFYAVDRSSGALNWVVATAGQIVSSPAVGGDGSIYVGSADGRLYAFRVNGSVLWSINLFAPIEASPAISREVGTPKRAVAGGNTIVVGTTGGSVFAVGPRRRLVIDTLTPVADQTLRPGEGVTYTITVTDDLGDPVANAVVEVDDPLLGSVATTPLTDGAGRTTYRATVPSAAAAGRYPLTFVATGTNYDDSVPVERGIVVERSGLVLASVTPVADQTLRPGEGVTYTISVTDDLGDPVTGAVVEVDDPLLGSVATTSPTDGAGRTTYQADVPASAAAGRYTLTFIATADAFDDSVPVQRDVVVPGTLTVRPPLVDFGEVPIRGGRGRRSVVLGNPGAAPLAVNSVSLVSGSDPGFEVEPLTLPLAIPPGGEVELFLAFRPQGLGDVGGTLVIASESGQNQVALQATGVNPPQFDFGPLEVGTSVTRTVEYVNQTTATVDVTGVRVVSVVGEAFTLTEVRSLGELAPSAILEADVAFVPPTAGSFIAVLRIIMRGPVVDVIELVGEGFEGARIPPTVQPDELVFAQTVVGTVSGAQMVAVSNADDEPITLNFALEGPEAPAFDLVDGGAPVTLAPSDPAHVVAVAFAPTCEGVQTATLRITWDEAPDRTVALRGTGRAPALQAPQPESAPVAGQDLRLRLTPPSFTATEAQLFYRRPGDPAFQPPQPLQLEGNVLVGTIPGAMVTGQGIEYYVRLATDCVVATFPQGAPDAAPPVYLAVQVPSLPAGVAPPASQHRMVSIPLALQDTRIETIFADDYGPFDPALWRVAVWQADLDLPEGGQYQDFPAFPRVQGPGLGFWLITASGQGFDVEDGTSVDPTQPIAMTLSPGWHQIGTPYLRALAWSSVELSGPVQGPHGYNGAYQFNRSTLEPWEAYFVYVPPPQAVTLRFPALTALPAVAPAAAAPEEPAFRLHLAAEAGALRDAFNYIGFAETPADALLNLLEPPPIGAHVRLSIREDAAAYAGYVKAAGDEGAFWDLEVTVVPGDGHRLQRQPVRITLTEDGVRPPGFDLYVFDLDEGRRVLVEEGGFSVDVRDEQPVRHLRLVIGTSALAEAGSEGAGLVPRAFRLAPNYPNPFPRETVIAYDVGQAGRVVLDVYNALGQRVRTLVDAEQPAGYHRVVWDGRDGADQPVASGLYLYRFQAGAFVETRTMLLLR